MKNVKALLIGAIALGGICAIAHGQSIAPGQLSRQHISPQTDSQLAKPAVLVGSSTGNLLHRNIVPASANAVASAQKAAKAAIAEISHAAANSNVAHAKALAAKADALLQAAAVAVQADQTAAEAAASNDLTDAKKQSAALANQARIAALKSLNAALAAAGVSSSSPKTCTPDSNGQYFYRWLLPLMSGACSATFNGQAGAPILNFFQVATKTEPAHQVQYLYNAKQSANQVAGDLFTATFPGFQAILAGTVTAGSSQPAPAGSGGSSTPPATTDSVATATAKLQQGGDFNVRFPVPLARIITNSQSFDVELVPNVGFTVNGITAQNTVTESTQYNVNLPIEAYYEIASYDKTGGGNNAVFFVDFKAGGEIISSALKKSIGISDRYFPMGQASAGIEFMDSIRIGFQYFLGPKEAFAVPNATGAGTTPATGSLGGFHLVVSYSPKSKSS